MVNSAILNQNMTSELQKGATMYGVVLWIDKSAQKAVIWCEDHGNLAYFNPQTDTVASNKSENSNLEVGDLIKFHVRNWRSVRRASKVELVDAARFTDLAGGLAVAEAELKQNETVDFGNVVTFRKSSEGGGQRASA